MLVRGCQLLLGSLCPDQSQCAAPAMGTSPSAVSATQVSTRTLTTLTSDWSSPANPGPSLVSHHTLRPPLCVVVTLMLRDQPITIHMGTGMEMWPGQLPIGQMISTQASDWSELVSRVGERRVIRWMEGGCYPAPHQYIPIIHATSESQIEDLLLLLPVIL